MKKIEEALRRLAQVTSSDNDQDLIFDAADELATLKQNLKGIETVTNEFGYLECPACGALAVVCDGEGHKPDCWLGKIVGEE